MERAHYKRALIKLSGEAFSGESSHAFHSEKSLFIARAIAALSQAGCQIGVVVGGGNIFRGSQGTSVDFDRSESDAIGMMATVINGLVLKQALIQCGIQAVVLSAFQIDRFVDKYERKAALEALSQEQVVIFVGGLGHPYFTTDSAAALRALEIEADILIKLTKVDGVYQSDPKKDTNASRFSKISYDDVLQKQLGFMDATAIALCREGHLPIRVCSMYDEHALLKAVGTQDFGTLIEG